MPRVYSYVVRYDSGFAPNPFYGFCTLATCKPGIRSSAQVGDWIVGSATDSKPIKRGGHLVYAMKIAEALTFDEYNVDGRFASKKPLRTGSRKQSCGDNIYYRETAQSAWLQRDSFHSRADGTANPEHISRDTRINRVLIGTDYVYFGGEGPKIPDHLEDYRGKHLVKSGIGLSSFDDPNLVTSLQDWLKSLGAAGYQGPPQEWISLRG